MQWLSHVGTDPPTITLLAIKKNFFVSFLNEVTVIPTQRVELVG